MKIIKVLILNFIFLAIILSCYNIYYYLQKNAWYFQTSVIRVALYYREGLMPFTIYLKSFDTFYKERKDSLFRPVEGLEYTDKTPIVLLGCSFAYGHILPDNEILSARLVEKAKRTVYNLGYPGWGVQNIIYLLQNNELFKNPKKLSKGEGTQYFIYWYINDHLRRMYCRFDISSIYYYLTYDKKDNSLIQRKNKHPFIDAFYVYKDYKYFENYKEFEQISIEQQYEFLNLHLKKIMEEKQKLFPNAKFILMSSSIPFPEEEEKILSNMNIKLLYTADLTGVDMETGPEWTYDMHPNPQAIELLSDALIKELDL